MPSPLCQRSSTPALRFRLEVMPFFLPCFVGGRSFRLRHSADYVAALGDLDAECVGDGLGWRPVEVVPVDLSLYACNRRSAPEPADPCAVSPRSRACPCPPRWTSDRSARPPRSVLRTCCIEHVSGFSGSAEVRSAQFSFLCVIDEPQVGYSGYRRQVLAIGCVAADQFDSGIERRI